MKDINLILENIVYMELLRRGYTVTVGKIGSREIDFVGQKQHEKLYVQVCYLLASDETIHTISRFACAICLHLFPADVRSFHLA